MTELVFSERGNALVEVVISILVFGGLMLPAITSISSVAIARRQADTAAWAVVRSMALADSTDRWSTAAAVSERLRSKSSLPLRIQYECEPACDSVDTVFMVKATVALGLPGVPEVSRVVRLERDVYAE